ncbi:GntR family transcriptional regulator [Microvirga sp. 17 mud 1-3]|uniref:GntR family transcriptional regulator n=1 Tax=Microvirga sp. 17 mud 1-3 TaxID=2082949 RepID=UPI000D6B6A50|nr:GntR family transcriptional regulator [Microvirga sp. 17 mud 1-3]AWM89265.1 GntR family transcriptional regulator [Microvirga sp. 17 mud 1-3]
MTLSPPPAQKPARKTLQHRTISAAVAEELRRRIVDGEFKAGFQLRQDALATEFAVSRIPVREALMQLEAEGLVKIQPHRGAVVSELSTEEVEELFELRALLEPRLLKASGPHLTEEDYRQLNAILQEYGAELRAHHVSRWGELNTEFHRLLYRHAGQPRTLAIVLSLLQDCDRHTRLQLSLTGGMERAEIEHGELVRLCAEGKFPAACALLKTHIENVGRSLRAYIADHHKA